MIEVLGFKRILGLAVLVGLVAALAGAHYLVLVPHREQQDRNLRSVKSEVEMRQQETQRMREEFSRLDHVKFKYNQLLKFGFFSDQDRVFAREKLNELQKFSKVINARYEIKPVEEEENRKINEAGHRLLKSQIHITLNAFDDIDVYRFLYLLNYGFPGQVSVTAVDVRRIRDVTAPVLQAVGSGSYAPIVEGKISLDWYTIAPKEKNEEGEGQ